MPARTFPNLGLQGGFDPGENGWDDEMTLNLLKLSVLTQGTVLSKVAAEPGAPTAGDVHILDETHATHPNEVIVFDGPTGEEAWVYIEPVEGWLLYNQDADYYEKFSGTVWAELATGGGGGGITDAPSDGTLYGRKDAAWEAIVGGGGGGGAEAYEEVDFSAVSSVDVESFAGLDIPEVRLVFDFTVTTNDVRPSLRYKLNGAYKTAANYRYSMLSRASSGTSDTLVSQSDTNIDLFVDDANFTVGNDAGNHCVVDLRVFSPNSNSTWKFCRWTSLARGPTGSFIPVADGVAMYDGADSTSPLQGLQLAISAGTVTGKVYVFVPGGGGGAAFPYEVMTQAEYDLLDPVDPDTFYFITE